MELLSQEQKDIFWRKVGVFVENAVAAQQLNGMRMEFSTSGEESRAHNTDYGETVDGGLRFDLQLGHSAGTPGLRT